MKVELDLGATRARVDDGALDAWRRDGPTPPPTRTVFAAAHVALHDSYASVDHAPGRPGDPAALAEHVDWETTMELRRRLAARGFGIAEAMDTAQRFDVGWDIARRLVEETGRLGLERGFVAGAGVDHLERVESRRALVDGVVHQVGVIRAAGGLPILLPLEWLPASGAGPDEYVGVYADVVAECEGPLLVHWLGEMFHPGLAGYFPGDSFERVMDLDPSKVRGCKLSLLDADLELRTRARLLERDQVVLTGDDHNFADLIGGAGPPARWSELDGRPLALGDFSHALLGVFDAVAPPAGVALERLAAGDRPGFDSLMGPCEALGRHLFEAPTRHYKAGLAFLAWLDGAQPNPMLANHAERTRDRAHYLRAVELAAAARVFTDAGVVARRLAAWLDEHPAPPSP